MSLYVTSGAGVWIKTGQEKSKNTSHKRSQMPKTLATLREMV